MKKFLSVILILCLVFASAVPVFAADASGTSLELVKYKGKVTVTTSAGKNVELKSDKGTKLVSGYTVKTGAASYAYISLDQTQAVKMDASTTVTIDQNGKKLDINLISGTLSYDVKAPLKKDQSTTVSTSNSITGIRGTFGLVRTFFDITLGRQISTTILFEGHSKVSTLGNNGSVVSTKDVFASNLLESIENVARLSQMTKEDFAGFIAIELAEDPALLSRVEKALAESGNPEVAAIDVREIAANAEEILAAEEKQAEEDAKALEAELAAQKAEQDRLEAAAKTDKLDGQEDAVQLFDGEAATDPATDAVSAEEAENASGDSGSGGSSGGNNGNNSNPNYDNTFDPASINDLDDAFTQANAAAAQGKTSVINAPAGQYNNPINLGQGVTLNAQDGFVPTEPVTLNGGKLTGTMNAPSSTINVNGTGSEISGNITAGTLNVGSGGGLNVATGSTLNTTAVDVSGGSMTNNGSISSHSVRVTNGELTNKNSVSADESLTVSGGTYDTTSGTTNTGGNVSVTGNGTLKGNSANKITIDGGNGQTPNSITIGSSTNADAPTFTGGVVLENNAVMNMNNGNFSGGVQVNGCTVNASGGTIDSIAGNSTSAKVTIDGGGTVTGGITGTFDKVTLSRGTVTGGINLTTGKVEVTAGTISGGTYGIKTTSNITVNGGNIAGTSYGIYASGDGLGVLINGGDISGATGVYLNAPTTGGGSTVYAFGGTITAGAGDGILLDGRANLELGQANSQTSCSIVSTGGHGINGEITTASSPLTKGSVKTSATDKYALNSSNFTLSANSSVLVSAPTGRLASDTNYAFSVFPDSNGYYTLKALTGGNSGSVTVTSYSELDAAFMAADSGGPTTIIVGGTNEITEGDRTVGPGITLVAASNYKPSKLILTGGTLEGTLNNPGTNGTTIETSGTSQNQTTSTIDGTFAVNEINVGDYSTLEIATTASITDGTLTIGDLGSSGAGVPTVKNYATLSIPISILNSGEMYNYGSISLIGEHLALSSNSKLYSQNGSISIGGTTGGSTGTLNLNGTSYIYGTVNMEGYSEANLYDSSIITNDTDTAALTASGNAIINVISGTINNTCSTGGTALSLTGETTATIGDVGGVSSLKGTAIEFAGKSLKVSGNSSSVSGTVGIAADRSTASDFGKISLLNGYITGTAGDGISIGENISVELGEFSDFDPYVSGTATVTGHTNGINITSTGSAFCYLLSGSVESESSTDYALNGTYGGKPAAIIQGNASRFYLGEVNTGAQSATYDNNSVRLKTAAAVAAGTPDITHLIKGQDGTGSARYAEDGTSGWYFLQSN